MKKAFIIVTGVILVILIVIASVPLFFKDRIKAKLLAEIDSKIDANVFFSDMSLSSLRNFPQMTLDLDDFYVVGKEAFRDDTLASVKRLSVSFDFYSVVNNNHKVEIKSIRLNEPHIRMMVLPDGKTNYSIVKTDSASTSASSFNIAIDHWVIKKGNLIYDDQQQHTFFELSEVNHSGNGDFTQDVSDLNLATSVASVSYSLNGIKYLDRKKLSTDLNMEMNLKESKFTFKDHVFDINHFKFGFEGYFKFLKQGYEVDVRILANRSDFKDLLSLMPGFYIEDFKKMKVTGDFTLDSHVKGVYDATSGKIPTFVLELVVKNGSFKYNHLPKGVDNINLDLMVENPTGIPGATRFDLRNFQLSFDHVPLQGRLKVSGIEQGFVDADIRGAIDLAQIEKFYPIEGTVLKGKLTADIRAKGNFDLDTRKFPMIDARVTLEDGYVKSADVPVPMENIHINAEAINTSGNLSDTRIELHDMTYLLDGEPFEMKGSIRNLVDYSYDFTVDGLIDLEKLTKLYPIPGMTVSGIMDVDIETSGKLSTLQSMHYDSLQSSGTITFKNISVHSGAMTQPFRISDAKMEFTPQKIVLEKFNGMFGRSDFALTGHLFDYHSWVFNTGRSIRGDLKLTSDTLDFNEMFPSSTVATDSSAAAPAVVEIPRQVDFTFDATVGYALFDQMKIHALEGDVKMKNGVLSLNETGFTSEEAKFALNGTYDTRDHAHPVFDMVVDIDKLDINKAFAMFETVQTAAPSAQNTDGIFSTKYHLKGELSPDFSPLMQTLTGNGTIIIADAQVKGMKMFNHVGNVTKKQELSDPHIKDIRMETEIKGGKVIIKPFSFQVGKYLTELEGTQSFDNTMDYVLRVSAPLFHKIKIPFHISGTVDKPIIKLGKGHENYDFSDF